MSGRFKLAVTDWKCPPIGSCSLIQFYFCLLCWNTDLSCLLNHDSSPPWKSHGLCKTTRPALITTTLFFTAHCFTLWFAYDACGWVILHLSPKLFKLQLWALLWVITTKNYK